MHIIFVFIFGGAAWWGMQQSKKGVAWGKAVTAVSALLAVVVAVIPLLPDRASPGEMQARVGDFAFAAGVGLGDHLAEAYPQARFRVLERRGGGNVFPPSIAEGLEQALSGKVRQVERILVSRSRRMAAADEDGAPEAAATDAGTPLRDALQEVENEVDVLVVLFPPPQSLLNSQGEAPGGKPTLVVGVPDVTGLLKAIDARHIDMALARRPSVTMHKPDGSLMEPPSDPMKAFSMFYQILTPANVGEFMTQNPHLVL